MKNYWAIFFLFLAVSIQAQQKIAGAYHVNSGNPDDGGYNWVLLEDHRFMMFTFGHIVTGNWKVDRDVVTLTPDIPKDNFALYGRHSSKVKGTKVMFSNFDINEDSFFGNSKDGLRPVLIENANCLPFPLVENFKNKFQDMLFSSISRRDGREQMYQADTGVYNDFMIVYYSSSLKIPPIEAIFKDNKLYFEHGETGSSVKEEINAKDMKEIEALLENKNTMEKETLVINKAYNIVSYGIYDNGEKFDEKSFLENNYKFDSSQDLYISNEKHKVSKGDEYHDYNLLYNYHKINLKPVENTFPKKTESIFKFTCGE